MDVLKKAHGNLEACTVNENTVSVQGKHYDANQIVEFPTKKIKDYTLKSVLFFLLNSKKSLKEYMSLCKENGIPSVSHIDKASILAEIQSFVPVAVKGFFISPKYESDKKYDVPSIKSRDLIIVPSSLVSKIHIDNVEKLLTDGVFESSTANPLSQDKRKIYVGGNLFTIIKNIDNFKKEDWDRVKAVFIDNPASEESEEILLNCTRDVAIFTFEQQKFKCVKLEISGSVLKNHAKVLECLR
ncbi:uncharacterized protein VICG_01393 [Vittaforma corneae ATCC 50505]|uniref:Cell division control protein 73 C-terminal domain-containing protein n=1 Tax=Vittaforma corneae (strain ATCC 50505) TaxID=993615 RepID=L2GLL6_VITCO|nr:uncharacterized protein VICG_01393 [Vittaforma corneae ATCC 50505]ELA41529.1 hypothetical protein VICG_01393 [Vittaforma corneae ATCC 50505]